VVESEEMGLALFNHAHQNRGNYQQWKHQSLIKLQQAIDEAILADTQLFDADLLIGKVRHTISKSGFQIPRTKVFRRKRQVLEDGSMCFWVSSSKVF